MSKKTRTLHQLFALILPVFLLNTSVYAAEALSAIPIEGKGYAECALGDLAADMLCEVTGADIALFAAADLGVGLPMGDITAERLKNSFPDNTEFSVVSITGTELHALLEDAFSSLVLKEDETINCEASASGDFFCISGLTLEYTAGALPGDRVYTMSTQNDTVYTVAIASRYVEGGTSRMLADVLESYLSNRTTVEYPAMGRMKCLDAGENRIVGDLVDMRILFLAVAVLLAFSLTRVRHSGGKKEKPTLSTDDLRHN